MQTSRRQLLVKGLVAGAAALAARFTGWVPEVGILQSGASPPAKAVPRPWFAAKVISQSELKDTVKDAHVRSALDGQDVRNLTRIQQSKLLQSIVVDSTLETGISMRATVLVVDAESVLVHYDPLGAATESTRPVALLYHLGKASNGHDKVMLASVSVNGRLAARSGAGSSAQGSAEADGCGICYNTCAYCCSFDPGFFDCCGPCIFACAGPLWACVGCVLGWCAWCYYEHCTGWCTYCCYAC